MMLRIGAHQAIGRHAVGTAQLRTKREFQCGAVQWPVWKPHVLQPLRRHKQCLAATIGRTVLVVLSSQAGERARKRVHRQAHRLTKVKLCDGGCWACMRAHVYQTRSLLIACEQQSRRHMMIEAKASGEVVCHLHATGTFTFAHWTCCSFVSFVSIMHKVGGV